MGHLFILFILLLFIFDKATDLTAKNLALIFLRLVKNSALQVVEWFSIQKSSLSFSYISFCTWHDTRSHKIPRVLADTPCYKSFPGRAIASKTTQIFLECCFKLYWVVFMGFWRGQNSSRVWKISKFFGARFPDRTSNSVMDGNWISGVVTIMFTSSFGVLVLLKRHKLAKTHLNCSTCSCLNKSHNLSHN